jgi:hypothetical protein
MKENKVRIGWRGKGGEDGLPGGSLFMDIVITWTYLWKTLCGIGIGFLFFLVIYSIDE